MLPGFSAEVSLRPAKHIYRTYFSTATVRRTPTAATIRRTPAPPATRTSLTPRVLFADQTTHCQQACAASCASVPQSEYSYCYNPCVQACTQPSGPGTPGGPGSTIGYCNPIEYQRCLSEYSYDPSLSGSCYLFYGPCRGGSTCCGEGTARSCVSLSTNVANCGRCGNECTDGSVCCGGNCCGGQGTNRGCCSYTGLEGNVSACVPLLPNGKPSGDPNNIYNCGQCGTMCTTTKANAYPVCQNGQCGFECNSGYFLCGGNCIPICTGGQTCINGSCQCPPGNPNFCNDQCVNYKTDNQSCGSCGKVCVGGQTCINGVCTCPAGAPLFCNNQCVNGSNDNNNCGGCGNTCTGGRQCISGSCQCTGGSTWCNGSCRNLKTDPDNCGSCNNSCASGVCQNGTCKSVSSPTCPQAGDKPYTFEYNGTTYTECCNYPWNILVTDTGIQCCEKGICSNTEGSYCADFNGNC